MNVKKQTGDQLVSELAIPAIDLIKIDVEGHEYEVLDGLRQTISQHQPLLMLEWADAVATRRIQTINC